MGYFDVANSPLLYVLVTAGSCISWAVRRLSAQVLEAVSGAWDLQGKAERRGPQFGGLHHRPLCLHRHRLFTLSTVLASMALVSAVGGRLGEL